MKKLLIISLTFLFIGCTSSDSNVPVKKNIVKVNGKTYTTQDIWDFSNIILWEMEPWDLANPEVKEKILNDFIEHRLLVEEAEKRGLRNSRILNEELFTQLATEEGAKELKAITGHYRIEADKVAVIAEDRLIIDELFRVLVNSTSYVSEDELMQYYESKNLAGNPVGEAHILHIFTRDNNTARAAAQELASGIIFSEVARKYSEGPEKDKGGDLGYIKEANYPEFFSDAFTLKEGETSPIIRSDYGYHIFKMVEYAQADKNSYNNLKSSLLAELYTIKRYETIREFINALRSNASIQHLNDFSLTEFFPENSSR